MFSKTVLHAKNNKNKESSKDGSGQQIVHATLCRTLGMIAVVTFDHNIILHELASLTRTKQVLPIKINYFGPTMNEMVLYKLSIYGTNNVPNHLE